MPLVLFRIDDRLIHGQVTAGWARVLDLNAIILVSDRIAASDWEGELFQSVAPPEVETSIVPVAGTAAALTGVESPSKRAVLLVENVRDARRIVDNGYRPERINVGGLHYAEGRKEVLPYLFLGPEDAADLAYLAGLGIELEARDVPGGRGLDVERLLKVFGFGADPDGAEAKR